MQSQPYALPLTLSAILISALAAWLQYRLTRRTGWSLFLIGSSAGLIVATTLTPSDSGTTEFGVCRFAIPTLFSLTTTQSLLNIAVFIPLSFAICLLLQRWLLWLGYAVITIAAIELIQATTAPLNKICDSDDIIANMLGVTIGAGVGLLLRRFAQAFRHRTDRSRKPLIALVVYLVIVTALAILLIRPVTDDTNERPFHYSAEIIATDLPLR